jgi:capsular exopolysaccharide synthesis family protein
LSAENRLLSLSLTEPQILTHQHVAESTENCVNDVEPDWSPQDLRAENVEITPGTRIVVANEPRSPGADRFRYLRMRLRELRNKTKLHSLVITSALPKDGKSTVALNVATVLAEGGEQSVLLVEADLHHPTLARTLGISIRPGLAESVEGGGNPLAEVTRLDPLGWYLLQAGKARGNPTELLQSKAFASCIGKLTSHFDWVLFDTPPVAPLTDALSVARQVDATLLVVRAHHTPCEAVDDALALLGPGAVAGVIFNAADHLNHLYDKYARYYDRRK